MSFLPGMTGIVAGAATTRPSFSLVVSDTGTGQTITIPVGFVAGDLCLIWNFGDTNPTDATPSGFTKIITNSGNDTRGSIFAKKLDGGETTVSGLNSGGSVWWIVAVFTPTSPFAAFANGMTPNGEWTNGDPSQQTISLPASTPALLFGQMGNRTVLISPRSVSPAMDELAGAVQQHYAHYKIYNPGDVPASHTYDMNDEGAGNVLQSNFLTFT